MHLFSVTEKKTKTLEGVKVPLVQMPRALLINKLQFRQEEDIREMK